MERVRIGQDPWPGCGNDHILPPELVECLDQSNVQYLSYVGDHEAFTIHSQGWKSGIFLGLDEYHTRVWDIYIRALRRSHI